MPKEVWVVATAGGVPHKVGAGDSPSFSPDGSRLLFVDKKRILTVAASGMATRSHCSSIREQWTR